MAAEKIQHVTQKVINISGSSLPIMHIDVLAAELTVDRRWIIDNWLTCEDPAPHLQQGKQWFLHKGELEKWLKRRLSGSVSTSTAIDPTD